MQLIDDASDGDIVLVEQIDRLARLNQADWDTLKQMLAKKDWQWYQKSYQHLIWHFKQSVAPNL